MLRLILALTTILCALQCTSANAQGRLGKGLRNIVNHGRFNNPSGHRSHAPPSSSFGGLNIGVGSYPNYGYPPVGSFNPYRFDNYVYDPYRFGSFRAPDLLNDPYFRERYRYDSKYPGRRYRAPLVVQPAVPTTTYESYAPAR